MRPFPDVNGGQWRVSSNGGTRPVWRGNEIFYLELPGTLMAVRVSTTEGFRFEPAVNLSSAPFQTVFTSRTFDVTRDGQRFLVVKGPTTTSGSTGSKLQIVENWFEEIARRSSTAP